MASKAEARRRREVFMVGLVETDSTAALFKLYKRVAK
jgi:hypothetical protein